MEIDRKFLGAEPVFNEAIEPDYFYNFLIIKLFAI